ncbi:Uncharacterized protein OBRU01_04444 [Operophtera brumata]|uniref:Uncharacterized protein n=1 Tax=Operophtera brumata TaxID=104452 RepID=A0A0L7LP58_OPEBR|nr:Uncharacterized protein OBRU01_04444 [Operophtera brumata]
MPATPTNLTVCNMGSIPGLWRVKLINSSEPSPFSVAPSEFEIRPGTMRVISLSQTAIEVTGGSDKPKSFPIKTNHNIMSWIRPARKELSLKNATDKKIHIRCHILGEGFSLDIPGVESRDVFCLPFAPGECRTLPIIFSPTSNVPLAATLHLAAIQLDRIQRLFRRQQHDNPPSFETHAEAMRGLGARGGPRERLRHVRARYRHGAHWRRYDPSEDTQTRTALTLLVDVPPLPQPTNLPLLVEEPHLLQPTNLPLLVDEPPLLQPTNLPLLVDVPPLLQPTNLPLLVEEPHLLQPTNLPLLVDEPPLVEPTNLPLLVDVPALLQVLRDGATGEFDTSLLDNHLKVLAGQFESDDPNMDNMLSEFQETKTSLNELIGGLHELTAQIVLPQDFADENTIIITDDTIVEHHTLCD